MKMNDEAKTNEGGIKNFRSAGVQHFINAWYGLEDESTRNKCPKSSLSLMSIPQLIAMFYLFPNPMLTKIV